MCVALLGLSRADTALGGSPSPRGRSWNATGRRDPFVFAGRNWPPPPPPPPPPPVDVVREARRAAKEADGSLAQRAFDAVVALASEHVRRLDYAGLRGVDVYERLVRLCDTAARMKGRAAAEEAFGRLRMDVTGVIWQESGASALVNSSLVSEGDVVEGARVVEIRRGDVLFRFRGVLVHKGIGR